jgi:hypothetical protein
LQNTRENLFISAVSKIIPGDLNPLGCGVVPTGLNIPEKLNVLKYSCGNVKDRKTPSAVNMKHVVL